MSDPIQAPGANQKVAPAANAAAGDNTFRGIDLSKYRLSDELCKSRNTNGNKVKGLSMALFPQCGDVKAMGKSVFYAGCDYQSKNGITWDLKTETGEIESNCRGKRSYFLKRSMIDIEIELNANALADEALMDWVQRRTRSGSGENAVVRAHGPRSIESYMLVLIDDISGTLAIYPDVQYLPASIQIKYVNDTPSTFKLMFNASEVDLGDGTEPFFYEVRNFQKPALKAA